MRAQPSGVLPLHAECRALWALHLQARHDALLDRRQVSRELQCAACGRQFTTDIPDEEAEAEFNRRFGHLDIPRGEWAVVCDPCYQHIFTLTLEVKPDGRAYPRSHSH